MPIQLGRMGRKLCGQEAKLVRRLVNIGFGHLFGAALAGDKEIRKRLLAIPREDRDYVRKVFDAFVAHYKIGRNGKPENLHCDVLLLLAPIHEQLFGFPFPEFESWRKARRSEGMRVYRKHEPVLRGGRLVGQKTIEVDLSPAVVGAASITEVAAGETPRKGEGRTNASTSAPKEINSSPDPVALPPVTSSKGGRPKLDAGLRVAPITARLETDLRKVLDGIASAENCSFAALARKACRLYVENGGRTPDPTTRYAGELKPSSVHVDSSMRALLVDLSSRRECSLGHVVRLALLTYAARGDLLGQ